MMKKLIFFIAFIAAFTVAKAQYTDFFQMKSASGYAADTVTNNQTKYLIYSVSGVQQQLKGVLHSLAVQVNIYKNSGTVAGNVYVETSLDLINWSNAYASYIAPSGDISNYSYSASDVAGQVFRFNLPNWADLYIRV